MAENLKYDGTFSGNILVVDQTRCGKTSFVQILVKAKYLVILSQLTGLTVKTNFKLRVCRISLSK